MAYSLGYSATFSGGSGGVATDAVTIPSGTDQTLIVFVPVLMNTGRDITSIALNGVSLTRRGYYTSGTAISVGIYTLRSPAAGSVNLVTTLNQSTTNFARSVIVADGVGDFAAIQDAYDANDATVASATGGIVIGCGTNRSASAIASGAGQTDINSELVFSSIRYLTSSEAGAATVTTSYTFTGGDSRITVGVALAPASGGGSSIAAISSGFHVRSINR